MFGLRGHEPSDYHSLVHQCVAVYVLSANFSLASQASLARTMADGRDSTPTDPRVFFLAARGPSLPALPKVSRDRCVNWCVRWCVL